MSAHPWSPQPQPQPQANGFRPRAITEEDAYFVELSPGRWQGKPIPSTDWIIKGLVAAGEVMMVSGDGGLGKSLLLQQLLTASALGQPWLGCETKRCRTWGLFCEDPETQLHIRQTHINRYYGCQHEDLAEDVVIACGRDRTNYFCEFPKFVDDPNPTKVYDRVMRSIGNHGAQIIGLDTVRKTFGGNEIRDRQVTGYVAMLRRLAMSTGGAVILTAHPSNEGVASGSGLAGNRAWRNEVRSMVYLTGNKDHDDARVLRTKKNNYGPPNGKIDLQYRQGVFQLTNEFRAEDAPCYEESLLDGWPEDGRAYNRSPELVHER